MGNTNKEGTLKTKKREEGKERERKEKSNHQRGSKRTKKEQRGKGSAAAPRGQTRAKRRSLTTSVRAG